MAEYTEEELKNMSPEQISEIQKQNCIFCKIIAKEIPSKKVYEDSDFFGTLDINPAIEGHILLLPKKHFQIMPQIPQETVGKMGVAVKTLSNNVLKSYGCEGVTVFIANGLVAGQKSPHFLTHIIPRKDGDGVGLIPKLTEIPDKEYEETKTKLMVALGGAPPKPTKEEPKKEKPNKKKETKTEDVDLDTVSNLFT